MEYIFFLLGGAGILTILAYFDACNDCNVPLDYLLIFLAIAAMAFIYSFFIINSNNSTIIDAVVFCIIAVLFRVVRMWNTADMMVFAGIALLLPQMAFLALILAWALYVVHCAVDGLKAKSRPFIPYLLIGYLISVIYLMFSFAR